MIKVTRLNNIEMVVNAEKIQSVQATPDTLITFTNRDRLMVKEPVEDISNEALCVRERSKEKVDESVTVLGWGFVVERIKEAESETSAVLE